MSFPEKKSVKVLEKYFKLQTQVYNDSCDMGINITRNEKARTELREALKGLLSFYKPEIWKGVDQKSWIFTIPIEQDGDLIRCLVAELLWFKTGKPVREFIGISFTARAIGKDTTRFYIKRGKTK